MRRRLALLVSAVTAMVLVALVVPLAIVVRLIIADRALADATDVVRSVSGVVATGVGPLSVQQAALAASRPVTVFLHGRPLGAPAPRTPAVRLAERGQSFTVADPGGREILVAVLGLNGGPAVVRTFVSNADLTRGVTEAWLILAASALSSSGWGRGRRPLVGSVTRPIGELAQVSHVLATGGLDARASPDGPPEVREVATGRITWPDGSGI
jgi:hypothetical protein